MADALDDDFAYSDEEVFQEDAGLSEALEIAVDDDNADLEETIGQSSAKPERSPKNKKQQQQKKETRKGANSEDHSKTSNNKRLKRQMLRQQSAQKKNIALGAGIDVDNGKPFGTYPSDVLEYYFSSVLQRHNPKLSSIEAQEYPLHSPHFLPVDKAWKVLQNDSKEVGKETSLAKFLRQALSDVAVDLSHKQPPPSIELKGSPSVLIITSDSGRASNLCTEVSTFLTSLHDSAPADRPAKKQKTESVSAGPAKSSSNKLKPAKLFGRHFKLEEQQAYLLANTAPIAVGTPARLRALLNETASPKSLAAATAGSSKKSKKGTSQAKASRDRSQSTDTPEISGHHAASEADAKPALNLDHLQYLVIDMTWRDKKNRNIFESDDARPETLRLLADIQQQRKERAEKHQQKGELSIDSAPEDQSSSAGTGTTKKKRKTDDADGNGDEGGGNGVALDRERTSKAAALSRWVVLY